MNRIKFVVFIISLIVTSSCSTFISKEYKPELKELEKGDYVLLKNISISGLRLAKNQKIKIIITGGDEWVKVYGYRFDKDKLRARRILILYLFENDFTDDTFNMKVFRKKLFEVISRKKNVKIKGATKVKKKRIKRRKKRKRRR